MFCMKRMTGWEGIKQGGTTTGLGEAGRASELILEGMATWRRNGLAEIRWVGISKKIDGGGFKEHSRQNSVC